MKELYETPTVEFIEFDSEEVITMSNIEPSIGDNFTDANIWGD